MAAHFSTHLNKAPNGGINKYLELLLDMSYNSLDYAAAQARQDPTVPSKYGDGVITKADTKKDITGVSTVDLTRHARGRRDLTICTPADLWRKITDVYVWDNSGDLAQKGVKSLAKGLIPLMLKCGADIERHEGGYILKKFGYKLAPSIPNRPSKAITYKQVMEKDNMYKYKLTEAENNVEVFHQQRIQDFDELEKRLDTLRKKLRQGKLSTQKYYRENPKSYSVVYGTDMINDYFNDIEELLTQDQ